MLSSLEIYRMNRLLLKAFISFVVAIVVLQGCTVEKRLYNRGFHVEWNKKRSGNEQAATEITPVDSEDEAEQNAQIDQEPDKQSAEVVVEEDLKDDPAELTSETPSYERADTLLRAKPEPDTMMVEHKYEPVGIVALSMAIVGAILLTFPTTVGLIISGVLFFSALVLSIISMIRFSRNRHRYKSNAPGVTVFVVCLILMLLVGLFFLAIAGL